MNATRISLDKRQRLVLATGLLLLGALLGALTGLLFEYIMSLFSFEGFFGVASHVGEPIGIIVLASVGLLLGLVGAGAIIAESLHADISDRDIQLTWKGASVRVRKDLISAIHLGTDLVLYSKNGVELARARAVNHSGLRCALIHHGYPTPSTEQVGEADFTTDLTALDEQEQRIAVARTRALKAGNMDIAEILRRQLAAKGVMSRDLKSGRMGTRTEFRRLDPFRPAVLTA